MSTVKNSITEEIVIRAQQGDTEAFNAIYKKYYNNAFFVGIQMTQNEEESKDIVQDVFLKVYKRIKDLKEPKAFHSWIQKMIYYECIDHVRNKNKKYIDLGDDMTVDDFSSDNDSSLSEIEKNEIKNAILDSIENLDYPLKVVGLLRFYEELPIKNVAEILNVSENVVKKRIMKIRVILKDDLSKKGIIPAVYSARVLTPTIIVGAYTILSNRYLLNSEESHAIYKTITNTGKVLVAGGGLALSSKILITAVATAVIIGGSSIAYNLSISSDETSPISIPQVDQEVTTNAKISSVDYNHDWTNKNVTLNVKTTGKGYDKILINDVETLDIANNGKYLVKLVKNNKVIDQKEIEVKNIDHDSPKKISETISGNNCVVYLDDDLSGIDYNSIVCLKNNQVSNDFAINQNNNSISFYCDDYASCTFSIHDKAGNLLEVYANSN